MQLTQEFLLILKGNGMDYLSPEALQKLLEDYKSWVRELVLSQRLNDG